MPDSPQKQPTHDLLLLTKLHMPLADPHLIVRPRLLEWLKLGMQRKLTLLSAPAGYGKTSLLVAWLRASTIPVAWVSLDEDDNTPARFWKYVCTTLNQLYPTLNEHVSPLFYSPQPLAIDYLLTTVINTLTSAGQDFVLVLDDYHLITTPAIHQGLTFLLDHLPPQTKYSSSSHSPYKHFCSKPRCSVASPPPFVMPLLSNTTARPSLNPLNAPTCFSYRWTINTPGIAIMHSLPMSSVCVCNKNMGIKYLNCTVGLLPGTSSMEKERGLCVMHYKRTIGKALLTCSNRWHYPHSGYEENLLRFGTGSRFFLMR